MQYELIQGVIAKKNNIMPIKILICAFTISEETFPRFTAKIIIGMLNIIIIKPPIVKFFLFKRFIEPDIVAIQVMVGEPIKKLKYIIFRLLKSIFNKIVAIGITIKNGT